MKIKRYLTGTINEAVFQIKQELGPEAVIVSSRRIRRPGWKGWLGSKLWEVTAALDQVSEVSQGVPHELLKKQEALQGEIAQVKTMLNEISRAREFLPGELPFSGTKTLAGWSQIMVERGISSQLTKNLLSNISGENVSSTIFSKAQALLEPLYRNKEGHKVMAFIGPTGVGKTTTIAKLAARFALMENKNIGIITVDTYRIGAVDQLRIYGDIIGTPVEVVTTPAELDDTIQRMQDRDIILIDTAGRSYKNAMHISTLKGYLDKITDADIFLVLSCTTKEGDLIKNVEIFQRLRFNGLIFTKVDETDTLGEIFNVACRTKVPVAYITNGQNVPDDIETMEPGKLAKLVLGGLEKNGPGCKIERNGTPALAARE